jgi:copper chaperone CopZ
MFIFSVKDMQACDSALAIIKAVKGIDANASVHVNLGKQGVEITPARAGATELSDAIASAGFTPFLLACGYARPGAGRAPPKIPFEGHDHDLGSIELRD